MSKRKAVRSTSNPYSLGLSAYSTCPSVPWTPSSALTASPPRAEEDEMDIGEAIGEFEIKLEGSSPAEDPIGWGQRACTLDSPAPDRPLVGWTFWDLNRSDETLTPLQFEITRHLEFGFHTDDPWHLSDSGLLMPGTPCSPPCYNRGRPCSRMPEPRCGCGTWAYKDRGSVKYCGVDLAGPPQTVFGEVLGWGRIALHERGWRSEHAYPLSFQIYCTDCYVREGVVVQADGLRADIVWRLPPHSYGIGFCTAHGSGGLSAYEVERYLRMRYLYATGFRSPFLELTDERLSAVLDRFGLLDWRANGQEIEVHRSFRKVRIFSLIFRREETDPHRVCQWCGRIDKVGLTGIACGPTSAAWKGLPKFVGRFRDFVCERCGQFAIKVRPPSHEAANPREWVGELLEDRESRFCGICQTGQNLEEMTQVRGEWLCSTCFSKLEDILEIEAATRNQ